MRLVEMGLESYLVTSAVSAALAQRLARRLCPNCKEPYEPTEADIAAAGLAPRRGLTDLCDPQGPSCCRMHGLLEHRLPRT